MLELIKRAKECINRNNDCEYESSIGVMSSDSKKAYVTVYEEGKIDNMIGLSMYGSARIFIGESKISLSYMPISCAPVECVPYVISISEELERIYNSRRPNETADIFRTDDKLVEVFDRVYLFTRQVFLSTTFIDKSELEKSGLTV